MENYENIKVNFDSFIQSLESNADDIEFRKKSFNHFLTNGFPKAKDEQWKYSPLTKDLNKFLSVEFNKSAKHVKNVLEISKAKIINNTDDSDCLNQSLVKLLEEKKLL